MAKERVIFVLPEIRILQNIEMRLSYRENLRRWVGNLKLYKRAQHITRILNERQFNLNYDRHTRQLFIRV